jgi:DNA-binding response OmpR family regulator/tetratricopeptide (TPR) repeat protein
MGYRRMRMRWDRTKNRVLIVAQEVALRASIARILQPVGYVVELAASTKRARALVADGSFDVAIIAPGSFGAGGSGLTQYLRSVTAHLVVLAEPKANVAECAHPFSDVTARLSLPLNEAELLGCMEKIFELQPQAGDQTAPAAEFLRFEGRSLDLAGHTFFDEKGQEVPLTRAEFMLLAALVRAPGRVLSRDQLSKAVAGRDSEPYDRAIDMLVARLRRKIEPDPKVPRFIITMSGRGYKFVAKPSRTGVLPTRIFDNVPLRDFNFTGRDDRIAEVHRLLTDADRPAAITQAAVYGLGGIGKTSVAVEYAHRYAGDYAGVWWAPAEQRAVLVASLAELAGKLDPRLAEDADQERAAKAGLMLLSQFAIPLLLIYDNVETPGTVRDLVPTAGARVLITTRWADWGGHAAEVRLGVLASDAAAEFLQKRAGRADVSGARTLAAAVGFLPLALDHAGAYCKLTGMTFAAYSKELDARILRAPKGAAYPASIAATFALAIERAASEHEAAETLLGFFAYIAPEKIPLSLVPNELMGEDIRTEAIMALSSVSLVEHEALEDGTATINLHRLVQAVTRVRLADRGLVTTTLERVTHALAERFPHRASNKPEVWPTCKLLLPHVLALSEYRFESLETAKVLADAGSYLMARTHYRDSEALQRRALALAERTVGRQHFQYFLSLIYLALVLHESGRYGEVEPLLREAIVIGEKGLGAKQSYMLFALNNLAYLLEATGRFEEAEPLYRRAIAVAESALGRSHQDVALPIAHLVSLLCETGRYGEAEPLAREAVEIGEKVLGAEHHYVARWLNILARVLRESGRYAEAEPLARRATAIAEKTVSREHPQFALILISLAIILRDTGRHAEAEPLLLEAIDTCSRMLGEGHPSTATGQRNLALLLLATGRPQAARGLAEAALATHSRINSASHPWTKEAAQICKEALAALDPQTDLARLARARS